MSIAAHEQGKVKMRAQSLSPKKHYSWPKKNLLREGM